MRHQMVIGGRRVGLGEPVFVIAEVGVNHNGDLEMARRLIEAAADGGADAVKFQMFKADAVASEAAPKAAYQLGTTDREESQVEMLRRLELGPEDFARIKTWCEARGVLFLATPHDTGSIDTLEELNVPAYKVGSGDATNLPFLRRVASKGQPILLSTGMCTLGEVEAALTAIESEGSNDLILLHCVSDYPAAIEDCNLRAMVTLHGAFGTPVGYSDHTTSDAPSLAAVALGACVIEKHFTLDQALPGPDHAASATPEGFSRLVSLIRAVEEALGSGRKRPTRSEESNKMAIRKRLVARTAIPAGTVITEKMLAAKRPGTGLSPARIQDVLGRVARVDIATDAPLNWGMLDEQAKD